MTFTVIGTAALKLQISQLIKDMQAGLSCSCAGMTCTRLPPSACVLVHAHVTCLRGGEKSEEARPEDVFCFSP